jgi:phosphotransferase system IIB component
VKRGGAMIGLSLYNGFFRFLSGFEGDPTAGDSPLQPTGENWLDFIVRYFWIVALILVFITVLVVYLVYFKVKKGEIIPMSEEAIAYVINHLGGMENIIGAGIDGGRLRFIVKQLNRCDLVAIKDLGALGVFVAGNTIKLMFPFDATALIEKINEGRKGDL